jgi:DNA-binding CsgD family transcriptional regulator
MTALTQRQKQVLQLMAGGLSNAAIGQRLGVTEDTVKTHNRRLFRLLGARDRTQAVYLALGAGLLGAPLSDAQLRDRIDRVEAVLDAMHETRRDAPEGSRYARLYDAVKAALSGLPERT